MTSPPRVLVRGARFVPGEVVALPEAESRHLKVSRAVPGAPVVLLDGEGERAEAVLSEGGRGAVVTRLVARRGEPARSLSVLLGVGEPTRLEWAVEKGTECGAAAFVLVAAARSQRAHVAAATARLERLRRIAAEAVKQCDRTTVPAVLAPRPLSTVIVERAGILLVARPGAPPPALGVVPPGGASVAVGPEGGFDPAEELLLDGAGAVPFGLGGRILRFETAVVAALSLLLRDDGP